MVVTSLKVNSSISLEGGNRPSRSLDRRAPTRSHEHKARVSNITTRTRRRLRANSIWLFCNKILARKNIILVKTIRAALCRTPYYVAQFTIKRDSKFHGLCLRRQETNRKVTFIHTYKEWEFKRWFTLLVMHSASTRYFFLCVSSVAVAVALLVSKLKAFHYTQRFTTLSLTTILLLQTGAYKFLPPPCTAHLHNRLVCRRDIDHVSNDEHTESYL